MTLDDELLKNARAAAAALAEAERRALLHRADYHTAIRRLHLSGAALREIAEALGISHQRVAQIVVGAGGSWWSNVWRTRNRRRDAVCTFCGNPPSEVAKLLAGPNIYICDACVAHAARVVGGERASGPLGPARRGQKCAFCGKRGSAQRSLTSALAGESICGECVRISREILDQRGA
jgi:hypothetical protein